VRTISYRRSYALDNVDAIASIVISGSSWDLSIFGSGDERGREAALDRCATLLSLIIPNTKEALYRAQQTAVRMHDDGVPRTTGTAQVGFSHEISVTEYSGLANNTLFNITLMPRH
jgi:hypothetical protein